MEPQAGGGATSTAIEYSEPYWSLRVAATVPVSCLDDTGRTDQQAKSPDSFAPGCLVVCLYWLYRFGLLELQAELKSSWEAKAPGRQALQSRALSS